MHACMHICGENRCHDSGFTWSCDIEGGKPASVGLRSIRVDKLQNRAWTADSLPGLAFLEEAAAAHQAHQEEQFGAASQPGQGSGQAADSRRDAMEIADVRAIWERDAWLQEGRRKVVMRVNSVRTVPVSLDNYLSDELRACARKCVAG